MSKIYDITMTIEESMAVWKNYEAKKPNIKAVQSHAEGKPHESLLTLNVHTGTHVDAPFHMIADGATVETIALERLIGPARVLDLRHVSGCITKENLEPFAIQPKERILLKSVSSLSEKFLFDFPYVNKEAAAYLAEIEVGLVAIDALGIERAQEGHPTHRILMDKGIIIVEGVRLKDVPAGNFHLVIAPLKLSGVDASPARAFLEA